MTAISMQHLVGAIKRVQGMSLEQRVDLANEVHNRQPNLLYSVLIMQRFGASLARIEILVDILLVFHEAMKASGLTWPVISDAVQDRCLQRVSARARFIEGLSPQQQKQAVSNAIADYPEQQLLAHVFAKFDDHGLLGIETEAIKMLMLTALNLVQCIAETAPAASKTAKQ